MADTNQDGFGGGENPLLSNSAVVWDRLIEAVGPASVLVVIETRMSSALRKRVTPEDIWQETLLHVWRDRDKCEWRGLKSFRSWVLTVADRRIRDAAVHENAQKRGAGSPPKPFSALQRSGSDSRTNTLFPGPVGSTTPSRIAMHKEQAAAMQAALAMLPDELGEVVRLRLFEQVPVEQVAERLDIGQSAVRHRFRKGAALYQRRLMSELASRSLSISPESLNAAAGDSSPT